MEKELRKKLELEIASGLKGMFKDLNPAAFGKMEKHIDEAARSLAKRFYKVKQKLMETARAASVSSESNPAKPAVVKQPKLAKAKPGTKVSAIKKRIASSAKSKSKTTKAPAKSLRTKTKSSVKVAAKGRKPAGKSK